MFTNHTFILQVSVLTNVNCVKKRSLKDVPWNLTVRKSIASNTCLHTKNAGKRFMFVRSVVIATMIQHVTSSTYVNSTPTVKCYSSFTTNANSNSVLMDGLLLELAAFGY